MRLKSKESEFDIYRKLTTEIEVLREVCIEQYAANLVHERVIAISSGYIAKQESPHDILKLVEFRLNQKLGLIA